MKFEIISLIISSLIGVLSIGASVWVLVLQSRNSRDIENIKFGLHKKGKVFEDKYSKTMVVLEKMGLLKNTIREFVGFYNEIYELSFNQEALAKLEIHISEYIRVRKDFFDYTAIKRYWIENNLMDIIDKLIKPTEGVNTEINKLSDIIKKIKESQSTNCYIGYSDLLKDYNSCEVDKLLNLINESMVDFENECFEKFKLK